MASRSNAREWSVVDEIPVPPCVSEPAWNMALDAYGFAAVAENGSSPRVRLYQWSRTAITLGKFQDPAADIDAANCRRLSLPVARRPTGGRGIVHGDDLTVSIAASVRDLDLRDDAGIHAVYDNLASILIEALSAIRIPAERGVGGQRREPRSANCMSVVSRADIVEAGSRRKLIGAALLRGRGAILMQCTIPTNNERTAREEIADAVFVRKCEGFRHAAEPFMKIDPRDLWSAMLESLAVRFGSRHGAIALSNEDIFAVSTMAEAYRIDLDRVETPVAHN